MKKNKITRYLDYQIIECANNDGIVLSKEDGELWESHLGNYRDVDDAKKAAIIHLMIARPMHFSAQLYHRVCGTHTCHDYFKFTEIVEKEHMELPCEIEPGDGVNMILSFKGELV